MPQKRKRSSEDEVTLRASRPRRDGVSYELKAAAPKRVPKAPAPKRVLKRDRTPPPSLNLLPTPPDHPRPPRQLFVWGTGGMGQLGLGADHMEDAPRPKPNPWCAQAVREGLLGGDNAGIETVAAGGMHSFLIDEAGKIWSWGVNDDAALGRKTKDVLGEDGQVLDAEDLSATPHVIEDLVKEGFRAVKVIAGDSIGAALNDKGKVRVWGSFKTAEGKKGFSSLHRRGEKSSALKESFQPVELSRLADQHFASIACGDNHLLALTIDGHIFSWGSGENGQVGRLILQRHLQTGFEPERIDVKDAVYVGAGSFHSFAIQNDGTVLAWGLNNWGQLGFESSQQIEGQSHIFPETIDDLEPSVLGCKVIKACGGEHHSLFLTEDGRVFAAGRCDGGQLGIASNHPAFDLPVNQRGEGKCVFKPVQIDFQEKIQDIMVSSRKNLALTVTGKLYSWGQGDIGIDDETDLIWTPFLIAGRPNAKWDCVGGSIGGQHSLGLFCRKEES